MKATSLRRGEMKRSQPKRDWSQALAKKEAEGCCRFCGTTANLEAAHVLERAHDAFMAGIGFGRDRPRQGSTWKVYPERIIPLCGACHLAQHLGRIDILTVLNGDEQLQAMRDLGSLEQVRVRTAPSCYREAA